MEKLRCVQLLLLKTAVAQDWADKSSKNSPNLRRMSVNTSSSSSNKKVKRAVKASNEKVKRAVKACKGK